MRKNALTLTCTACVSGAFGIFCRWIQGMSAFEENGLYKPGSWSGIVLILMYIAALAALIGFTVYFKSKMGWPRRLSTALPPQGTGAGP